MGFLLHWSDAGIVNFPGYVLGAILIILLPGPNSLYVLTVSAQQGWRQGVWAAFGIFIGDAIIMLGVALGAATLLQSSPLVFNTLRLLGAAYLAWLGIGIFRSGLARLGAHEDVSATRGLGTAAGVMRLHPLLASLLLSLTNHKAIFFFISFFTQFVNPDFHAPALSFFYLAVVTQIISMAYLIVVIAAGQYCLRITKTHPNMTAIIWFATGMVLMAFSARLLLEIL